MKRRRVPRWPAMPPRGMRPMLQPDQVRDLGMAHIVNLDLIARGPADVDVMWQWVGGALTWSAIADKLHQFDAGRFAAAAAAMLDQLVVCNTVIERYTRLGRVGFAGLEYQRAKDACEWMDALAEVVDQPTASICADWSERRLVRLQLAAEQGQAA